jgi:adenosylcobinamide-phosphate synthase
MKSKIVLILALTLDVLFGDPPNRFHPAAWMGSLIGGAARRRPYGNPKREFAYGAAIVLGGGMLVATLGELAQRLFRRLPQPLSWLVQAAVLKTTFALHGLDRAAGEVQRALESGDLPEARRTASWSLVSRDTSQLDESLTVAAAIESTAENLCDGVVAPLFYYALGGLPLALVYRFVNTADSMLGYHSEELEWLGKAAARTDDLLNLAPARLSGALIAAAAPLIGSDPAAAWRVMRRDARRTQSPNAGYPMSAMAGALGVELEKLDHYRLGDGGRKPTAEDLCRARRTLWVAAGLAALLFLKLIPDRLGRLTSR